MVVLHLQNSSVLTIRSGCDQNSVGPTKEIEIFLLSPFPTDRNDYPRATSPVSKFRWFNWNSGHEWLRERNFSNDVVCIARSELTE